MSLSWWFVVPCVLLVALGCQPAPSELAPVGQDTVLSSPAGVPLSPDPDPPVTAPEPSPQSSGAPEARPSPADLSLAAGETLTMPGGASRAFSRTVSGIMAPSPGLPGPFTTDDFGFVDEAGFSSVALAPLSTFSADVDTASYTLVRRMLTSGRLPPPDAVRIEELLNYFDYDYPPVEGDDTVSLFTALAPVPWAPQGLLLQIGLSTEPIPGEDRLPASLVFLIDVSGSMSGDDRLPLVRRGMALLVDQLRPQDRLSIVVYAGAAGVVLETVSGDQKAEAHRALSALEAGGSTAGAEGIELAYQLARQQFVPDGHNRVILVTDGDFNVGPSSPGETVDLVASQVDSGIYLSVFGVGLGNLQDQTLGRLADSGNGAYHYLDSPAEARRALLEQLGSALSPVADDLKLQIEFNPARVERYRLLGYMNRRLAPEQFADPDVDAGDVGAGHSVTALYEIVPGAVDLVPREPLRYQQRVLTDLAATDELLRVSVRYRTPGAADSHLLSVPVFTADDGGADPVPQLLLASAVAEFGFALRRSPTRPDVSLQAASARARRSGLSASGRVADFLELVDLAADLLVAP